MKTAQARKAHPGRPDMMQAAELADSVVDRFAGSTGAGICAVDLALRGAERGIHTNTLCSGRTDAALFNRIFVGTLDRLYRLHVRDAMLEAPI